MAGSSSQRRIDAFLRDATRVEDTEENTTPTWSTELRDKISNSKSIADLKNVFLETVDIMSSLYQENQALKTEIKTIKSDLGETTSFYDQEIKDLSQSVQDNVQYKELCDVMDKVDDLENRSRRNNVRFQGIPEGEEKRFKDTEEFIENFVKNNLKVNILPGSVQRAHRVGPQKNPAQPRAIVAQFQNYKDKEAAVKAAPKERPKMNGTNVYVNHDFSTIVMQKRKSLLPLLEEKRKGGNRAWLHYKLLFIENGCLKALRVDSNVVRERNNKRRSVGSQEQQE